MTKKAKSNRCTGRIKQNKTGTQQKTQKHIMKTESHPKNNKINQRLQINKKMRETVTLKHQIRGERESV